MYPNFDLTLTCENGALRVAGPLLSAGEELRPDIAQVVVFAYVTQQPKRKEAPRTGYGAVPPSATTARGEVKLYRDNPPSRAQNLVLGRWEFKEAPLHGPFEDGWAYGSAVQLTIRDDGSIETYSWHSWIWIEVP